MRRECLDEGMIQMFLDGEASPELADSITYHIEACDECAARLADADEENSVVFAALDRDLNTLVPTHRLWDRISESIETERSRTPFWERAYAFLSVQLLSPSLTAAAGVIVLSVIAGSYFLSGRGDVNEIARTVTAPQVQTSQPAPAPQREITVSTVPDGEATFTPVETAPSVERSRPVAQTARYSPPVRTRASVQNNEPRAMTLQYVPGEESYIRTIEELNTSVEMRKDRVLPPSSRIAFERDLAIVNDSISRMQQVVRRNPRDQAAKQVLYAAYQNKIDLLNSVGEREELMASLR